MRILVFGHSDSAGTQLSDPGQAWPFVLQQLLTRDGGTVELRHDILVPLRADASEAVAAAVEGFAPDVVMVHLNPYSFAIQLVGLKVRERFGPRAGRWYRSCERRFDHLTSQGQVRALINRAGRRAARRVLGTASTATYAAVVEAYSKLLHQLARSEDLQVVVMGGSRLARALQHVTPGMTATIAQFATQMEHIAHEHRFVWFDTEASVAGPARETLFLADGVHRSPEGHGRLALMLVRCLEDLPLEPSRTRRPAGQG